MCLASLSFVYDICDYTCINVTTHKNLTVTSTYVIKLQIMQPTKHTCAKYFIQHKIHFSSQI